MKKKSRKIYRIKINDLDSFFLDDVLKQVKERHKLTKNSTNKGGRKDE